MNKEYQFNPALEQVLRKIERSQDKAMVNDEVKHIQEQANQLKSVNWRRGDLLEKMLTDALTK